LRVLLAVQAPLAVQAILSDLARSGAPAPPQSDSVLCSVVVVSAPIWAL
jgi:hypothetical protein